MTFRGTMALFLSVLTAVLPVYAQTGTEDTDSLSLEPQLFVEIEGRPILHPEDVLFYGPRTPRMHFHGERYVSERVFFEIAGDDDAARRSRNFRAMNIGLGVITIASFFAGLALFSTADDVDLSGAGFNTGMTDRGFSLALIGGSLVPAAVLTVRRQQWATLEYTYQTMTSYNETVREP